MFPVFFGEWQPWFDGGETAKLLLRRPGHRRAAPVASLEFRPKCDAVGILQLFKGNVGLGQPELLALVNANAAAQRKEQSDQALWQGLPAGWHRPSASSHASRRGC